MEIRDAVDTLLPYLIGVIIRSTPHANAMDRSRTPVRSTSSPIKIRGWIFFSATRSVKVLPGRMADSELLCGRLQRVKMNDSCMSLIQYAALLHILSDVDVRRTSPLLVSICCVTTFFGRNCVIGKLADRAGVRLAACGCVRVNDRRT